MSAMRTLVAVAVLLAGASGAGSAFGQGQAEESKATKLLAEINASMPDSRTQIAYQTGYGVRLSVERSVASPFSLSTGVAASIYDISALLQPHEDPYSFHPTPNPRWRYFAIFAGVTLAPFPRHVIAPYVATTIECYTIDLTMPVYPYYDTSFGWGTGATAAIGLALRFRGHRTVSVEVRMKKQAQQGPDPTFTEVAIRTAVLRL